MTCVNAQWRPRSYVGLLIIHTTCAYKIMRWNIKKCFRQTYRSFNLQSIKLVSRTITVLSSEILWFVCEKTKYVLCVDEVRELETVSQKKLTITAITFHSINSYKTWIEEPRNFVLVSPEWIMKWPNSFISTRWFKWKPKSDTLNRDLTKYKRYFVCNRHVK